MLVGLFGVGKAYIDHSKIDRSQLSDAITSCTRLDELAAKYGGKDAPRPGAFDDLIPKKTADSNLDEDAIIAKFGGKVNAPPCAGRDAAQLAINSQEYKIDNERDKYASIAAFLFILGALPFTISYLWYFMLRRLAEVADAFRGR